MEIETTIYYKNIEIVVRGDYLPAEPDTMLCPGSAEEIADMEILVADTPINDLLSIKDQCKIEQIALKNLCLT